MGSVLTIDSFMPRLVMATSRLVTKEFPILSIRDHASQSKGAILICNKLLWHYHTFSSSAELT